ncbi:MAG: alpha-glucan family phosphorylase [Spirochaetaceae bacterium]
MQIIKYTVSPQIPKPLKPLQEIAHNVWLSWNHDAVTLFTRLDFDAWIASHQNPVRMLGMIPQERYEQLARDDSYLASLHEVNEKFQRYKQSKDTWYTGSRNKTIAYFSMEYGLDVSLPIYSGGLGVLSGDHMKTASDLGLPLVGVGLLYQQGYFQQYLNADGFQQERYPENDWYNMPVNRCTDKSGEDVKITVKILDSVVVARIWEVKVGRNSLYLLDTNIDENREEFRSITAQLYGGDRETRMRQEILLGIGGIRALKALGIEPAVTHMNEGHSAFLGIERIRNYMQDEGLSFDQARQAVWPTNIFTTHTPVPAGNERFPVELMQKYFHNVTDGTGLSWEAFMALGRENPEDPLEHFCMTVLALKLSAYNNGVSELHGDISRDMWKNVWGGLPVEEVPIGHITNGVHPRNFLSEEMTDLLDRYFGPRFYDDPTYLEIWDRIDRISDEELWRTHEARKNRLVAFARKRLREQLESRGGSHSQLLHAEEVLSPYAFTISFARRFATYKRATLLFRDPERLKRLLSNTEYPVQLIFAGKAHPHDIPGKNLIKDIVHFASDPELRSKIVFLENYDMTIAKQMVSGSDLWLNTPRRPLEASGTSGMKAGLNGVLNCSVLDGWWAEGYDGNNGFAIGHGEEYEDEELQDEIESTALYDLLEREIIPTFFERGHDGLPRDWITMMKNSMSTVGKEFSTHRMLMDYSNQFYLPALRNADRFGKDEHARAKSVAEYVHKLETAWQEIEVAKIDGGQKRELNVGDTVSVSAHIALGSLTPEQVTVEALFGRVAADGSLEDPERLTLKAASAENGMQLFKARIPCRQAGRQGLAIRVLPNHPDLVHRFVPGYVVWAD